MLQAFCVNYLIHSTPLPAPLHSASCAQSPSRRWSVHNTRCATQCPPATCNTVVTFVRVHSCQFLNPPATWKRTCSVSNNAKRHRTIQSMLVQVDVQEPTISVCRVPYARASGFALIAKLPVIFQPMTPRVSERTNAFGTLVPVLDQ